MKLLEIPEPRFSPEDYQSWSIDEVANAMTIARLTRDPTVLQGMVRKARLDLKALSYMEDTEDLRTDLGIKLEFIEEELVSENYRGVSK